MVNWMGVKLLKRNIDLSIHGQPIYEIFINNHSCVVTINFGNRITFEQKNQKEPQPIKKIKVQTGSRSIRELFKIFSFFSYKNNLYSFKIADNYSEEEKKLLIKEHYFKEDKKFKKLQKEVQLFERLESMDIQQSREPIPEEVRFIVWRRDGGKCVKCGGKKNLEFDHIIPVSKGGSNTERNLQLLCQKCNREKSAKI
ncbi:MAG: HNH endonuclease [Deltaproteobacteria bacterium]|nr:HNH endonuclease [Deltaproteobacteria bacterium]